MSKAVAADEHDLVSVAKKCLDAKGRKTLVDKWAKMAKRYAADSIEKRASHDNDEAARLKAFADQYQLASDKMALTL